MVADTEVETTAPIERLPAERPVRLRKIGWWLLGVSVLLVVLSMAIPALVDHPLTTERGEIRVFFDVFSEGNLPTWWSVGLLVLTAISHAVAGTLAVVRKVRGAWAWFVSAGMLGVLSLDDHTALHERLERIGQQLVTFERFPDYWLVPGILAGLLVALALGLLAVRLTGATRWCLIAGCALLLGSAMGMELIQGLLVAAAARAVAITRSGDRVSVTYAAQNRVGGVAASNAS